MDFIIDPKIWREYIISSKNIPHEDTSLNLYIKQFFIKCFTEKANLHSYVSSYKILFSKEYESLVASCFEDENYKYIYKSLFLKCMDMGLLSTIDAEGEDVVTLLNSMSAKLPKAKCCIMLLHTNNYKNIQFDEAKTIILNELNEEITNTKYILLKIITEGKYGVRYNNIPNDFKGERYPRRENELTAMFTWIFKLAFNPEEVYFYDDFFQNIRHCAFLEGCKIFNEKHFCFYRNPQSKNPEKRSIPENMKNIKEELKGVFGDKIIFHSFHNDKESHYRIILFNNFVVSYTDDLKNILTRNSWTIDIEYSPYEYERLLKLPKSEVPCDKA